MNGNALAHSYLPGLHGLRFFAALIVFLNHVELFKHWFGLDSRYDHPFFFRTGGMAVTFFFVLSGFLITTLLLREKETKSAISVSKFYLRRVLRIWPLYFLVVLGGLFLFPHIAWLQAPEHSRFIIDNLAPLTLLFLLFLPQIAIIIFPHLPIIGPAWTIGVEEQFYFIWPLLLSKIKSVVRLSLFFLLAFFAGRVLLYFLMPNDLSTQPGKGMYSVYHFLYLNRLDGMAMGALFAGWVFQQNQTVLSFILHPVVKLGTLGLVIAIFASGYESFWFNHTLMAGIFSLFIVQVSRVPIYVQILETRLLRFLGELSYTFYLTHSLALIFLLNLMRHFSPMFMGHEKQLSLQGDLVLYIGGVLLSILLSVLVYYGWERRFLKWKEKFRP